MQEDNKHINHKQTVEYFNLIFENSKGSKMEFHKDKKLDAAIRYIVDLFNITHIQSCLLAIIFIFTLDDTEVGFERLLNFLGMNLTDYFDLQGDVQVLLDKGHIIYRKENRTNNLYNSNFSINQKVIDAIFNGTSIVDALSEPDLDINQLCGHISRVITRSSLNNCTVNEITEKIERIENKNSNLDAVIQLKKIIQIEDRTLLYNLINEMTTSNVSTFDLLPSLIELYGRIESQCILRSFINKETNLQKLGLLEVSANGYAQDATITLTDKTKEIFFGNHAGLYLTRITNKNIIRHDSIFSKELFFDEQVQRELALLEQGLQEDNFIELRDTLKSKGFLNNGVTAILYGVSGGGKTSGVYQIARKTNRDIMQLDLSQIRSMYYGESEKQVKEIFNSYRDLCNVSERTPILLLNECDAVLGKRLEGNSTTDTTETTLVNLFLEFFETNTGIIIATTNLINTVDPSFFRRFLFKVKFSTPSPIVVKQILKNKLDFLTEKELETISIRYRLTGGEIDNILTKITLNKVLTKSNPTINEIMEYCEQEKISDYKTAKLGFN